MLMCKARKETCVFEKRCLWEQISGRSSITNLWRRCFVSKKRKKLKRFYRNCSLMKIVLLIFDKMILQNYI
jgi:hypothetical protein